jgi:xylulokinase
LGDSFLGIDIGTSSVKVLLRSESSEESGRVRYDADRPGPRAWMAAIEAAVARLRGPLSDVAAIGLAGQTNTYLLWDPDRGGEPPVVPWSAGEGAGALAELLALPPSFWVEHISMPHPAMVSYPAPRILWMARAAGSGWERAAKVLQPKDWVYFRLTGRMASDPFTWRGLAHLGDGTFHRELLERLGIEAARLPELHAPEAAPGALAAGAAGRLGLRPGIPVHLGCNDFFASLAGMGTLAPGDWADVAGSSEHLARIETRPPLSVTTPLVYGPGLVHNVHYGVTAASGVSLDWGLGALGTRAPSDTGAGTPLFLPYLQGERAPHFDPDARGVFFGLERGHEPRDLLAAVCEGVAFSLRQIASLIDAEAAAPVRTAPDGPLAAAVTRIKADVFGRPFVVVRQRASAALGAAMIAAAGAGRFAGLAEAASAWVALEAEVPPRSDRAPLLEARYRLYVSLYPALRESFARFAAIKGGPPRTRARGLADAGIGEAP